jgi:hypothetical protein
MGRVTCGRRTSVPPRPRLDLHCFVPDPPTTKGEGRELRRLASQYGWRTVIVVTFRPHISRARFILEHCFDGDLVMVASPERISIASSSLSHGSGRTRCGSASPVRNRGRCGRRGRRLVDALHRRRGPSRTRPLLAVRLLERCADRVPDACPLSPVANIKKLAKAQLGSASRLRLLKSYHWWETPTRCL